MPPGGGEAAAAAAPMAGAPLSALGEPEGAPWGLLRLSRLSGAPGSAEAAAPVGGALEAAGGPVC